MNAKLILITPAVLVGLSACGSASPPEPDPMGELPDPVVFTTVSVGGFHACGVTESATISCWGENTSGQLGTSNTDASAIPVPVNSAVQFAEVAAGGQHTCGLAVDGTLYCWGADQVGQLGRGTSGNFSSSPAAVVGNITFRSVSASSAHTCAVSDTGDGYCWGVTENGRLGHGSGTVLSFEPTPTIVVGGLSFTTIVTGASHTCGLVGAESYCWGRGSEGQLGHGMLSGSESPVLTVGSEIWQALSAGPGDHTCGIDIDGDVHCWGDNGLGQAGAAGGGTFSQPNAVSGGITFGTGTTLQDGAIAAGTQNTCALISGGSAYCWGGNHVGQLGTGNMTDSDTPVPVVGGLRFTSLSSGGTALSPTTCGLSTERIVYCWGSNSSGLLGQFDVVSGSATPLRVFGQASISNP